MNYKQRTNYTPQRFDSIEESFPAGCRSRKICSLDNKLTLLLVDSSEDHSNCKVNEALPYNIIGRFLPTIIDLITRKLSTISNNAYFKVHLKDGVISDIKDKNGMPIYEAEIRSEKGWLPEE